MFFSPGPFSAGVFILVAGSIWYFGLHCVEIADWITWSRSTSWSANLVFYRIHSEFSSFQPSYSLALCWPYFVCFVAICSWLARLGVFQYLPIWYFPHCGWYLTQLISGHPDRVARDTIESLGWLKAHTNSPHNLEGSLGLFRLDSLKRPHANCLKQFRLPVPDCSVAEVVLIWYSYIPSTQDCWSCVWPRSDLFYVFSMLI